MSDEFFVLGWGRQQCIERAAKYCTRSTCWSALSINFPPLPSSPTRQKLFSIFLITNCCCLRVNVKHINKKTTRARSRGGMGWRACSMGGARRDQNSKIKHGSSIEIEIWHEVKIYERSLIFCSYHLALKHQILWFFLSSSSPHTPPLDDNFPINFHHHEFPSGRRAPLCCTRLAVCKQINDVDYAFGISSQRGPPILSTHGGGKREEDRVTMEADKNRKKVA